jgi:hypothetical protein
MSYVGENMCDVTNYMHFTSLEGGRDFLPQINMQNMLFLPQWVTQMYSNSFNILLFSKHTVTHMTPARQRLGKHDLKAGIAAEVEVNLLENGTRFRGNGY